VGAQHNQAGKRKLSRLNINGDVNMRLEFDDASNGLALEHYCYLPTVDGQAPTIEQLIEGVIFIRSLLADGGKVYIHCHAGVGRAPTMAAAYFISQGLGALAAIELIRKVRPFIDITNVQLERLKQFEVVVHDAGLLETGDRIEALKSG